jgi:DNA end-binding protein Ku
MAKAKQAPAKPAKPEPSIADLSAAFSGKTTEPTADLKAPKIDKKSSEKSTWKGMLQFGLASLAVKLYTATEVSDGVKFHQFCPEGHRINSVTTCKECDVTYEGEGGKDVLLKGTEWDGKFVTLTKAEQDACKPASSKAIEIDEFVPADAVDPIYFESTRFITADKGFEKQFAILRTMMEEKQVYAVASLCERGRENTVIIRPFRRGMLLHNMYFEHEIRNFDKWENIPEVVTDLDPKMFKAAGQLIDMLTGDFNPQEKFDSYAAMVRKAVEAKAKGEKAPEVKIPVPVATTDLMAALVASMNDPKVQQKSKAAKAGTRK